MARSDSQRWKKTPVSSTSRYSCASWGVQICTANSVRGSFMNSGKTDGNGLCLHQEHIQTMTVYRPTASAFKTSVFLAHLPLCSTFGQISTFRSIRECNTNCRLWKALTVAGSPRDLNDIHQEKPTAQTVRSTKDAPKLVEIECLDSWHCHKQKWFQSWFSSISTYLVLLLLIYYHDIYLWRTSIEIPGPPGRASSSAPSIPLQADPKPRSAVSKPVLLRGDTLKRTSRSRGECKKLCAACCCEHELSPVFRVLMWAMDNIWYIAPSHQFLKNVSVLLFLRFWYIGKCYRFFKSVLNIIIFQAPAQFPRK